MTKQRRRTDTWQIVWEISALLLTVLPCIYNTMSRSFDSICRYKIETQKYDAATGSALQSSPKGEECGTDIDTRQWLHA